MPNMSAMTFLVTPWRSSSSVRSAKTWLARPASGARMPPAVASWAMKTIVCWTMASMRSWGFCMVLGLGRGASHHHSSSLSPRGPVTNLAVSGVRPFYHESALGTPRQKSAPVEGWDVEAILEERSGAPHRHVEGTRGTEDALEPGFVQLSSLSIVLVRGDGVLEYALRRTEEVRMVEARASIGRQEGESAKRAPGIRDGRERA